MKVALIAFFLGLFLAYPCLSETSEDAYILSNGTKWTLGTAMVEKSIALQHEMLVTTSFKNKANGQDLAPSNTSGPWTFVGAHTSKLKLGELELDLTLRRGALAVTKSYVVYPGTSIIREWAEFKNMGAAPLRLTDPEFLQISARVGDLASEDFDWMTGGDNAHGSWTLRTEKLQAGKSRRFDSYDPFPAAGVCGDLVDGKSNILVFLNGQQVWPKVAQKVVQTSYGSVPVETRVQVAKGDRLVFLVPPNPAFDFVRFDPTIAYGDGETHIASREFSGQQRGKGWAYQSVENGKFIDLSNDASAHEWVAEKGNLLGAIIGPDIERGGLTQEAARVWTAPKSGSIRISGSACSLSNSYVSDAKPGFRAGSSSYAPWVALYNHVSKDGLFIGWDYFGHWTSSYATEANGRVTARMHLAGYHSTLMPGQAITTPKAFVGLFEGDLDSAGNTLLDWQYRYMWDYTRPGWFPGIRMMGYWWKGTSWGLPQGSWTGGKPDYESTFRKVFRLADMMREVGADVYHRDWGWWDIAGDWNGPDFRTTGTYLRKSDMGQLIYAFLYTVDPRSKVAREHPDWLLKAGKGWLTFNTLDMSRPEVVAFLESQLDSFATKWGDFEWRNDSMMTSQKNGDDTPLLGQDQGMRELLQHFLDTHPGSAFQAVNSGGLYAGYDYIRFASNIQFSDAAVGLLRDYWATLLFPPDKLADNPDAWRNIANFDSATWRGWLCLNPDTVGDTWDPTKLDGLRELFGIYHYLESKGVVGRWVHVFRPVVVGDDPIMYFQRMSRDGLRGIIIPKHTPSGPVTIKPKGLLPTEIYVVNFQESQKLWKRTGEDLMTRGITMSKMEPGELIYLNLPMHPGSRLDTEAPQPPSGVTKVRASNMGYPGIEIRWQPGSDNNWISYYEILRNGISIDRVAKGTFYFDHSAGADLAAAYAVRTVDGAGNLSGLVQAQGSPAIPSRIVDDAAGDGTKFSSGWQHQKEEPLVAYDGTITSTDKKGATAELTFEGKRVLWFTKLGAENGEAAVSIDGGPAVIVDTYSADDIWGVAAYQREFSNVGQHTIRVEVLGKKALHPDERSAGTTIFVDGFRIEQD